MGAPKGPRIGTVKWLYSFHTYNSRCGNYAFLEISVIRGRLADAAVQHQNSLDGETEYTHQRMMKVFDETGGTKYWDPVGSLSGDLVIKFQGNRDGSDNTDWYAPSVQAALTNRAGLALATKIAKKVGWDVTPQELVEHIGAIQVRYADSFLYVGDDQPIPTPQDKREALAS